MLSNKLKVLVTRAVFPSVIERLAQHFDVESNQGDVLWGREELLRRVEGKDGLFVFGTERVDAELLSHCPRLRIAANMMVGYNNFDIPALNSARVVGTNAPDVLTESTVRSSFLTTPFRLPLSPSPLPLPSYHHPFIVALAAHSASPPPKLQADFGFALLLATARRVSESEHFLRAGRWNKWSYDM